MMYVCLKDERLMGSMCGEGYMLHVASLEMNLVIFIVPICPNNKFSHGMSLL